MKKLFALFVGCIIGIGVVTSVEARENIVVVGSSTVYPFTTVVAEKHGKKGWKTPIVESTGTGGGMKLFCAGLGSKHPDFTNASRAIKKSEIKLCKQNGVADIIEVIVGNDGIVFAHKQGQEKWNLTKLQLWEAMALHGPKPLYWNEIDSSLPKQKIHIMAPPPTSGTRDAWNSLVMKAGCKAAGKYKELGKKKCASFRDDGPVEEAGENDTLIVKRLGADPKSFGIFGFSFLHENQDLIQSSLIEGKQVSLESIQNYSYPISRPLFFYAKKAHFGVIPGMKEFMAEYTSDASMGEYGYLSDLGLVPLESATLSKVRYNVSNLVANEFTKH
jgi:phosphate transport system substrate-binding protein